MVVRCPLRPRIVCSARPAPASTRKLGPSAFWYIRAPERNVTAASRGLVVKIPIQIEPASEASPAVEYRWDPDTEILSAQLNPRSAGKGLSGSVELEGADGSWLILDVSSGRINGVEVAVW